MQTAYAVEINNTKKLSEPSAGFNRQGSIPPAPPGPYISTGLQDITAASTMAEMPSSSVKPSLDNKMPQVEVAKPVSSSEKASQNFTDVPMQTFSPDIPWPTNMRPTAQRYPDSWATNPNMPVYGNKQVRQRTPSIDANAQRPAAYMPNYGSSGYGYQMPNRYLPQDNAPSGYPVNRAPYPSDYQQGYPK